MKLFFYDEAVISPRKDIQYTHIPLDKQTLPVECSISTSAENADFIFFPFVLDSVALENLANPHHMSEVTSTLPFAHQFWNKHVFFYGYYFDSSDDFSTNCVLFRTNVHKNHRDPFTFAFPYIHCVEDIGWQEMNSVRFHASFVGGTRSWDKRPLLAELLHSTNQITTFINTSEQFQGWHTDDIQAERRKIFITSLAESLVILCPRGNGIASIRFFETLCAGRIPALISDDVLLPLADIIDYQEFTIFIPEAEIHRADIIIRDWLAAHSAESLAHCCRTARSIWEQWFSPLGCARLIIHELSSILRK